jgi:tetratricopeptide (TPR) repeat protein
MDQFAKMYENMTPEQKKGMEQMARNMSSGNRQYMINGAQAIKEEGNKSFKGGMYNEALSMYSRALENLRGFDGSEVTPLKVALLNNSAACQLKLKNFTDSVSMSEKALQIDPKNLKALQRIGQAKAELGDMRGAVSSLEKAAKLSPGCPNIAGELKQLQFKLNCQHEDPHASESEATVTRAGSSPGPSTDNSRMHSPRGDRNDVTHDKRPCDAASLQQEVEKLLDPAMLLTEMNTRMRSAPCSSPVMVRASWFLAGVGVGAIAMRLLSSSRRT